VHATVCDRSNVASLLDGIEGRLVVHDMDLLDAGSMTAAVKGIVASEGRLDVLINNAGYGLIGGVEQVDLDRARASFETNFFGSVVLIQEVLPVMRRQRGGLIVNLSSIFAAGLCPPGLGYYIASKAALETVSQALAVEAEPWGVRVTNFQPGPVMTALSREWGKRLSVAEDPRPTLSDELYDWVLCDQAPAAQSPGEVAAALCEVVESDSPQLARQSGPPLRPTSQRRCGMSPATPSLPACSQHSPRRRQGSEEQVRDRILPGLERGGVPPAFVDT
jgi:NAD(P)-dependent dehydrogenase (short-subunit alcohol dehydrogenase family)